MNELTENLVKEFSPRVAIIAYASDEKWSDCYLESHIIENGKIMAGKPLRQETIEGMVDVFFDQQQNQARITGFIPENLLQFIHLPGGHFKMTWYRPAERHVLHFQGSLKIPTGEAWCPPMVWSIDRKVLSVYALDADKRPTPETKIFRAPFHNVADGGDVCLGSAKVAKPAEKTYTAIMKYWEDLFWLSIFTHLHGSNSPTKTNMNMLWKRLIASKRLKWDQLKELKQYRTHKLKDILK